MRLVQALRYTRSTCISFVGAGGKTTALFRAAREIIKPAIDNEKPNTVLITTSTHLGAWQAGLADHSMIATTLRDIERLRVDLPVGVVLITGEENDHLLSGLHGVRLDELQRFSEERNLPLLIEADGAHTRPLKAPAEHEPAIPDFTQHVVVVAGMTGLGKPLTSEWVHRPEIYSILSGKTMGEEIDAEALARVLLDKHGGLKAIPCGARKSILLNQADDAGSQSIARKISERLIPTYEACIIASLNPPTLTVSPGDGTDREDEILAAVEPIAGIILAAGGSTRFGQPKQLLMWRGMPLIRHVAITALQAGLAPVVVVVGNSGEEVSAVIQDLPVRIVNNSQWERGMSSSIKSGIQVLPPHVGGVVFLQSDQPQIPLTLVRSLVEAHWVSLRPIIAPQIDGQRGNPVLFDVTTFPDLLALEGDIGGRALFARHPVKWLKWHDSRLLLDIDTPEDFTRFLDLFPSEGMNA